MAELSRTRNAAITRWQTGHERQAPGEIERLLGRAVGDLWFPGTIRATSRSTSSTFWRISNRKNADAPRQTGPPCRHCAGRSGQRSSVQNHSDSGSDCGAVRGDLRIPTDLYRWPQASGGSGAVIHGLYSVGHWERDVLVVDANGFDDRGWLDAMRHRQSEALPFTVKATEVLLPDSDVLEYVCTENEKDRAHL